jgi:hypothetical protein
MEANRLNLRETATLFERTLKGLQDGDATLDLPGTKRKHIRKQLAVVEQLWMGFKPLVDFGMNATNEEIPKEKTQALAEGNLLLLAAMNKAVKLYEQESSQAGQQINRVSSRPWD